MTLKFGKWNEKSTKENLILYVNGHIGFGVLYKGVWLDTNSGIELNTKRIVGAIEIDNKDIKNQIKELQNE